MRVFHSNENGIFSISLSSRKEGGVKGGWGQAESFKFARPPPGVKLEAPILKKNYHLSSTPLYTFHLTDLPCICEKWSDDFWLYWLWGPQWLIGWWYVQRRRSCVGGSWKGRQCCLYQRLPPPSHNLLGPGRPRHGRSSPLWKIDRILRIFSDFLCYEYKPLAYLHWIFSLE